MSMWNSLKADVRFCVHAVGQEYAERRWYKIVSTTLNRTNRLTTTVVGSGIGTLTILFIYNNRAFLFLNKRWVAIIILSILTLFLMWVAITVRGFHERTVGELEAKHQSEMKGLKAKEKEKRFKLFRRYRKILTVLNDDLKPKVSIVFLDDQPGFITPKVIRQKHYRVLRVRVTNDGGEPLYDLRAQLKFPDQYYSYSDIDLTLKEEDLPIIGQILYRREIDALPKPRTLFSLRRGESQFVNVAMQEAVDGKWSAVTLCLSHIGADNYGNTVNVQQPNEFSIIVLGGLYPPYSKSFILFLDDKGILRLKEAE